MKIAITGASGLIGAPLGEALRGRGHEVHPVRRETDAPLRWSVQDGFVPIDALSGFDAVVHLAGENLGSGRWTPRRKAEILQSRREGTRRVVEALQHASPRPHTLVCASGTSIYGDTGDREIDEDAPAGTDFIAQVATAWEAEARAAEDLGVRVANMRTSMVLATTGGGLPRMLPFFRMGLGGRLGDGRQWMPWIHITDAIAAYVHVIEANDAKGPFNVVAPGVVDNRTFTRTLAQALHRPAWLPVPSFGLRMMFGEMADLLLMGQRATPSRLLARPGFAFAFPDLAPALADLLR